MTTRTTGAMLGTTIALVMPLAVFMAFKMTNSMISPFLPIYTVQQLNQTVLFVGLMFASYSIASLVTRIPASMLADRFGTRLFVFLGAGLNIIAMAILLLTSSPELVVVSYILQGVAFATFQPAMLSYVSRLTLPTVSSRQIITFVSTGFPLGSSIGPMIGGFLYPLGFVVLFSSSALLSGITLVIVSIVLGFGSRGGGSQQREQSRAGPVEHAKVQGGTRGLLTKKFISVLISRMATNYTFGALLSFLPLFATQVLKFEPAHVGLLLGSAPVFAIAGRPTSSLLLRLMAVRSAIIVSLGMVALSMLLMALFPNGMTVWIATALLGLGAGIITPLSFVQVADMVPEGKRTVGMGLLTMSVDTGTALGSAASAFILLIGGYFWVFAVASLFSFVVVGTQLKYE